MNHIALMRHSQASGHFAQVNTLVLAAGLALVQASIRGWHDAGTGPVEPDGAGWFHTVGDLWWNPAQAIVTAAAAFATAWLSMTLVRLLIRKGAADLHRAPHRTEQRMTAAIDYSTAFALPIVLGSLVLTFRVLSVVGSAGRWAMYPPAGSLELIAGIVAGLGAVFWWFWLLRLGAAAPERSRWTVMTFLGAAAPLVIAGVAISWWFALEAFFPPLFERMGVSY